MLDFAIEFMPSLVLQWNILMQALLKTKAPEPRPRPLPRWKEAERYFQRERDRKIPVTLPRVQFLEGEDE